MYAILDYIVAHICKVSLQSEMVTRRPLVHLSRNDPDAYVALTGCPVAEDVEFTILSGKMDETMFRWTKEGNVELISDFVGVSSSRAADRDGFQNDEVVFDQQLAAAQLAAEKNCEEGNCEDMPSTMKVSKWMNHQFW